MIKKKKKASPPYILRNDSNAMSRRDSTIKAARTVQNPKEFNSQLLASSDKRPTPVTSPESREWV